ncbi:phage tail protein [Marinifilum sp. N1E240]|uniref:phage tail protein n=1 Tax=Marinifilum sp. N1E240 TaxID=2608082 RepID=UPI00128BACCA|nr:tail fiber protein [Marinifilum sp. N1E240]MPQ49126.1 phage tail protein [Marinifilum sp. N1E240]
MEGTLAEIRGFAGNFSPRNWAYCYGQIVSIAQNTSLYSLLGTTFGGDGRTTFGIPDLRGRVPIGQGQAPGMQEYYLGQFGGQELIRLTHAQLPAHNHAAVASIGSATISGEVVATMNVNNSDGENRTPEGNYLGFSGGDIYQDSASTGSTLNSAAITVDSSGLQVAVGDVTVQVDNTGDGGQFPIIQPFLCINWIICIDGLYPQRDN